MGWICKNCGAENDFGGFSCEVCSMQISKEEHNEYQKETQREKIAQKKKGRVARSKEIALKWTAITKKTLSVFEIMSYIALICSLIAFAVLLFIMRDSYNADIFHNINQSVNSIDLSPAVNNFSEKIKAVQHEFKELLSFAADRLTKIWS